jgi:class 3 adenylate cyclase
MLAGGSATAGPPVLYPTLSHRKNPRRPRLQGERKQVTVLFADIKDSTELIRDLAPEAAQQLLDPAIHRMMDAVHRYEGTVNQVLGDGIMALFGAPIAHDDHALRACYAALAM